MEEEQKVMESTETTTQETEPNEVEAVDQNGAMATEGTNQMEESSETTEDPEVGEISDDSKMNGEESGSPMTTEPTVQLPEYCFVSSPLHKDPAWCVGSTDYYCELCESVDKVEDSETATLSQLNVWPPESSEVAETQLELTVNLKEKKVTLGGKSLDEKNIRYCYILSQDQSDVTSVDGGVTHVLVLSYWEPDYTGTINNLLLTAEDEQTSVRVMNLIRKMIADVRRLQWLQPLIVGSLSLAKVGCDKMDIDRIGDSDYQAVMVTLDEEAICFCSGSQLKNGPPDGLLRFTRETQNDAIEKIYAHTVYKLVEMETTQSKFVFKKKTDDSTYKRFAFYVQGRIRAKSDKVFDFKDPSGYQDHMEEFPLELYKDDGPLYIPLAMAKKRRQAGPVAVNGHADRSDIAEAAFRQHVPGPRGADRGEASGTGQPSQPSQLLRGEESDEGKTNYLITQLMSSTSQTEAISEDLQVMWFTLEHDIETAIRDGLVPESEVESGGLDENSYDHFQQAIKAIQDDLFEQRLPQAISKLQGVRRAFEATKFEALNVWLTQNQDIELLKQIYLTSK